MNFIIDYTQKEIAIPELVGGKASNLTELQIAGQRVPVWYVLTTELMVHILDKVNLRGEIHTIMDRIKKDYPSKSVEKQIQKIQHQIRNINFPDEIITQIKHKHQLIIQEGRFFSVRSSAVEEDSVKASFAGLHDSFLFIRDTDELVQKIKYVWASAYNLRAIIFRIKNNICLDNIRIAVIVQEMVEADISGLIFTANPNNLNVQELIISSLYGAGEGIVSAGLDADLFIYSKQTGEIKEKPADKTEKLIFNDEKQTGLKRVAIEPEHKKEACLGQKQILELANIGIAIERHFGKPQDIEFSMDKEGNIYILQSRPITTIQEYGPAAGNRIVWDNSNIIESYSGVTSPMTFSFIRRAYTIVYHCFAQVMGIPKEEIRKNRYVFENMLGLFNGQVYYNLINWYKLVRLFPGFNYNKSFMESMMGLKEKLDLEEDEQRKVAFYQKYFIELPKLLLLLFHSICNFIRIEKLVNEFEQHFNYHYNRWMAMDFSQLPPHELMQVYYDMEDKLLWNWKTPIINDFYVMIFYGLLKQCCYKWCHDENESLQNDLICGEGDIESAKPTKLLMEISQLVRNNERYRNLFCENTPVELAEIIPKDKAYKEIADKINFYIENYGFRRINELKLEEPSLRETPEFLYQMIQNYIKMENDEALNPKVMEEREHRIRSEAERKANMAMGGGFKKLVFGWILRNARRGVRNRENMRFARTKIYGVLHELLNATGNYLKKEQIIDDSQDIYYLTIDEVWDYIKGTAVTTNLKGLIRIRKEEFTKYKDEVLKPADHFETYGMAYHRNLFQGYQSSFEEEKIQEVGLKGIGCCPGRVTAKVKIVKSPKDDLKLNGEILVANRTDPGWVPLYPAVCGILIERGSILSHSAIIAREMGIPTIVGIPNLLNTLKDGQIVTMDGSTGKIILQSKK